MMEEQPLTPQNVRAAEAKQRARAAIRRTRELLRQSRELIAAAARQTERARPLTGLPRKNKADSTTTGTSR